MGSRGLTVAAYGVIGLALVLLEILGRFTRVRIPTAAEMLRRALSHRSAQFGIVLAWWWFGWHFFVG
jgi:Family of unknown function (DUF6186)